MALLSYLGILVLIPLLRQGFRIHKVPRKSGLTLFIVEIIYTVLNRLIMAIFGKMFIIGPLFSMIFWHSVLLCWVLPFSV